MKKTLSLLLLFVLAWPSLVFGEYSNSVESLRGVDGFKLRVVLSSQPEGNIFFEEGTYKTIVELKLRQFNIPVLERDEVFPLLDPKYLYLHVNTHSVADSFNALAVSYQLKFSQEIFVSRRTVQEPLQEPLFMLAPTWSASAFGIIDGRDYGSMKDAVNELVDLFVNDYLKVNLPQRNPEKGSD